MKLVTDVTIRANKGSATPTRHDHLRGQGLLDRARHQQSDEHKQVPRRQRHHSNERCVPTHGYCNGPCH